MKLKGFHSPLYILVFIAIIGIFILVKRFKSKGWLVLGIIFGVSAINMMKHPLNDPLTKAVGETYEIIGEVQKVHETEYRVNYILEHVIFLEDDTQHHLNFKIQVESNQQQKYDVGDLLKVVGEVKEYPIQYNPSDMDYNLYLKGEGIGGILCADQIICIREGNNLIYTWKEALHNHINIVFQGKDRGIIESLILGDKTNLDEEISTLYNQLGIGHILAISGIHVGIIYGMLWWGTGKLKFNYYVRHILIVITLWGYCILTGLSISALRATTVITLIIMAKLLWEELDLWIGISWVSCGLVILNPYVVYQVGYQLSFIAYAAVILWQQLMLCLKYEYRMTNKQYRVIQFVGGSLWITLWINPVLAYHFYEVPIVASLFNLAIVSVMELMIPLIILILTIGYLNVELVGIGVSFICTLLNAIELAGENILLLPLATKVIGRPEYIDMLMYYIGLILFVMSVQWHLWHVIRQYGSVCALSSIILANIPQKEALQITQLYVGQGDAAVILTPNQKSILIDGGADGKGKILRNYLYYNGVEDVALAVVSHPHNDHIAGIIELIEQKEVNIENVCMPYVEDHTLALQLEALCAMNNINLYKVNEEGIITVDGVTLKILGPEKNGLSEDLNALSIVMLLEYGNFRSLYTGDLPKEQEIEMLNQFVDVDVLKVGHHGSITSTSSEFLQQITPEYGIISCSKNNLYNHPSPIVVERLEEHHIEVIKTYEAGAIKIRTDGDYLQIDTHRGG